MKKSKLREERAKRFQEMLKASKVEQEIKPKKANKKTNKEVK